MVSSINIDEKDEHVFEFDLFELTYNSTLGFYIISEEGYFVFNSLTEFKNINNSYVLEYEGDTFVCSDEDFSKIKLIYSKFF